MVNWGAMKPEVGDVPETHNRTPRPSALRTLSPALCALLPVLSRWPGWAWQTGGLAGGLRKEGVGGSVMIARLAP